MNCSECDKELGAVLIFDSSTGEDFFCEECHREDMRQSSEKRRNVVSR